MRVRFASWNVNGFRRLDTQLDLMRQVKPNVLALQEVTPHAYRALADATLFDWIMFSLDLREPQAGEGRKRRLGCVLCGDQYEAPCRLRAGRHLYLLCSPERAACAHVSVALELVESDISASSPRTAHALWCL